MKPNKFYLHALSALALLSSGATYANQLASAPTLEGGFDASVGIWYAVPTADNQEYATLPNTVTSVESVQHVEFDYNAGLLATVGYVFEDSANGVELAYRLFNAENNDEVAPGNQGVYAPIFNDNYNSAHSNQSYEFNSFDLMVNQFLDVGRAVQMRFAIGASYVSLEQEEDNVYFDTVELHQTLFDVSDTVARSSEFSGFGPRVGVDARYDFGNGIGVLGASSLAYYLGELNLEDTFTQSVPMEPDVVSSLANDTSNHGVLNVRANLAIDYVFFLANQDRTAVGIELGYQFDYYDNIVQRATYDAQDMQEMTYTESDSLAVSFSGPYINLKGAF